MIQMELHTSNLYPHLIQGIEKSDSIYILSSFIMKSGVTLIYESLKKASQRGADIKICTGDYLYITSPDALEKLLTIDGIEIRMFRTNNRSFHPKAYLFRSEKEGFIVIGSSNLSQSALQTGVEWNLSLSKSIDSEVYEQAFMEFMDVFYHEQTISINGETIQLYQAEYEDNHKKLSTSLGDDIAEKEISTVHGELESSIEITPHDVQVEALKCLQESLDEGYQRSMVVMATGLGKTYLSAFFAKSFSKVLFIAHREEILRQAERSFKKVDDTLSTGLYFGKNKEKDCDVLFASIQTLSMKHHLTSFSSNAFDLIIVDEFHHAAANSYRKVIEYFQPKFLLGMTATPDRLDGANIYALCDNNVAFQMHFLEAIEKGFLVPFHYVGVYDDIDYSKIRVVGGKYDSDQLEAVQIQENMAQKIFQAWEKHRQSRTIGFCSSIRQADFLTDFFNKNDVRAVSLHSRSASRQNAIESLEAREIDIIFTVDLFNEGVDIPLVDTLLFVRPTESISVFTQQIGRGLRLAEGKQYCQIIDLIGNYRNLDAKLCLFNKMTGEPKKIYEPIVPELCEFELETKAIDIIKYYKKPLNNRLIESYYDVKRELGRRPTYLETHLYGREDASKYKKEWGSFAEFLLAENELNNNEKDIVKTYSPILQDIEKTVMNKSYKMVLLLSMLERGKDRWAHPITAEVATPIFMEYLMKVPYRRKIDEISNNEETVTKLIYNMPMSKWSGSSKGIFELKGNQFYVKGYAELGTKELYQMVKEICEYRLHLYFEKKADK
ncbi:DEAD/DEAH box helicase family protein [Risungbinella massiliensis]|uniref:DEAD/DEAH box helicase family protein n=1 Tax=Risungbinella massiliensis TaxID=1329796 RepID=UPI0005CC1CD3|nr:DEAD/DEAH box helicase family protein [Risungbinella massiliensis]